MDLEWRKQQQKIPLKTAASAEYGQRVMPIYMKNVAIYKEYG